MKAYLPAPVPSVTKPFILGTDTIAVIGFSKTMLIFCSNFCLGICYNTKNAAANKRVNFPVHRIAFKVKENKLSL
jgi:hypothetical protein